VSSAIGALFLVSAMGKSAQLPFSGWIVRAMEGPTPSSALFYGGVSIHAGMYLLLRVWPMLDVAPVVAAMGVVVGLLTALYATLVVRTHADAKGTLAHATLAQVGLILAEISLGFTALALAHLAGHALLRVWQYLRAPNAMHDAHRIGHSTAAPGWLAARFPALALRVHAAALHRFRLDEWLDRAIAPLLRLVRWLDALEGRLRAGVSLDRGRDGGRR
jgi:NADH-quinone oxidoreductase subunit L